MLGTEIDESDQLYAADLLNVALITLSYSVG